MGRILVLDWGERRIGIAISDSMKIIGQTPEPPLSNNSSFQKKFGQIMRKYEIELVILGLPVSLSGFEEHAAEKVRAFGERLSREYSIPVEYVDERLTTGQAKKQMSDSGFGQDRGRRLIDNASAQILLQQYLDSKNRN